MDKGGAEKSDKEDVVPPKRKSLLPTKGAPKKAVKNLKELSAEELQRLE